MFEFILCALALQPILDAGGPSYREKMTRPGGDYEKRFETCVRIVDAAVDMNVPPSLAASVAMTESRFNETARSSVGAIGPMQVIPKYHKPPKGWRTEDPNLLRHGVSVLLKFLLTEGCEVEIEPCDESASRPECEALRYAQARRRGTPIQGCDRKKLSRSLCKYAGGGKCGNKARRYARNVIKRAFVLEASLSFMTVPRPLFCESAVHMPHEGALICERVDESGCGEHWHDRYLRDHCSRCPDCCTMSEAGAEPW